MHIQKKTKLVIKLREEDGLIGLILTDKFRVVYPDRTHKSVLSKVTSLQIKGVIR